MTKLILFLLLATSISQVQSWKYKDKINTTVVDQFIQCQAEWHQCEHYILCVDDKNCSRAIENASKCWPSKCHPIYNSTLNEDFQRNVTIYEGPGCFLNCYNIGQPSIKNKTSHTYWENIFTCPGLIQCLDLLVQFSFKIGTISTTAFLMMIFILATIIA